MYSSRQGHNGNRPGFGPFRELDDVFRRHPLLKLLAVHLGIGILASVAIVLGLLAFDAHKLRTLLAHDETPVLTFILMLFGFIVTLGSIAMGTAIMSLSSTPDEPEPPRGKPAPLPVRARAAAPARVTDQR